MDIRLTDFQIAQVVHAQCDMARPLSERSIQVASSPKAGSFLAMPSSGPVARPESMAMRSSG